MILWVYLELQRSWHFYTMMRNVSRFIHSVKHLKNIMKVLFRFIFRLYFMNLIKIYEVSCMVVVLWCSNVLSIWEKTLANFLKRRMKAKLVENGKKRNYWISIGNNFKKYWTNFSFTYNFLLKINCEKKFGKCGLSFAIFTVNFKANFIFAHR